MKKPLLALLCVCLWTLPGVAQSIARYGAFNISCNAVTATGVCAEYSLPLFGGYTVPSNFTWQVICTGTCSTISTTLEGSVDGRTSLDGVATASSSAFTSATLKFTAQDVGKDIYIGGAATGGATFETTIATYVSATAVTLTANPNLSIVGAPTFVGTFATLDTSTNTAGETRSVVNYPELYLRCHVGTLTGAGATVQCGFTVKGN